MTASRIKQKLKEIEENLVVIQDNLPASEEEFKMLGLLKDGIYKRLEFCIQNVVDIFSMIYSEQKMGVPSSLDDIFTGLSERKIFPRGIIKTAEDMKGLRNILIHKYGRVDDAIVFELLTEKLDDFHKIIKAIEHYKP